MSVWRYVLRRAAAALLLIVVVSSAALLLTIAVANRSAAEGQSASPTFREALRTDEVTDAVLASAATREWVQVAKR